MNAGHFLRLKNKIAIAPKKCTTSDTLTCFNKICLLVHVVSQVFFCKAISTIKRQERVLLSDGKLNIFVRVEEINSAALLVDRRHQRSGNLQRKLW